MRVCSEPSTFLGAGEQVESKGLADNARILYALQWRHDCVEYPEKRRHPRLPVLVDCRVDGASGRAEMRLTDLSPVGCYIDTSIVFPPHTRVTLSFKLGDSDYALAGRVVPMPTAGFGFGVEFVDLDEATRQRLEAYIRQAGGQ